MQQQLVEKHLRREHVDMLTDGQHRGHERIAALHHYVWHGIEQHLSEKRSRATFHIDQKARNQKEHRHMECIDKLFGLRKRIANIHQMKRNHQYDHHAFQIVQFFYTFTLIHSILTSDNTKLVEEDEQNTQRYDEAYCKLIGAEETDRHRPTVGKLVA